MSFKLSIYTTSGTGLSLGTPVISQLQRDGGGGNLLSIPIVSGGTGYLSDLQINLSGGGGFGAKASATVVNGVVTAINIIFSGAGYTSPPSVTITNVTPVIGSGNLNSNVGSVSSTPVVVDVSQSSFPYSVTVIPGSGNTSKVEYSITPTAVNNPGSANWITWPSGTVSAATNDVYAGKLTALRFTRVSGSSTDTYEVLS